MLVAEEEFALEILLRELQVIRPPPVGFPPATVEAKPAHFVLRGRRIL